MGRRKQIMPPPRCGHEILEGLECAGGGEAVRRSLVRPSAPVPVRRVSEWDGDHAVASLAPPPSLWEMWNIDDQNGPGRSGEGTHSRGTVCALERVPGGFGRGTVGGVGGRRCGGGGGGTRRMGDGGGRGGTFRRGWRGDGGGGIGPRGERVAGPPGGQEGAVGFRGGVGPPRASAGGEGGGRTSFCVFTSPPIRLVHENGEGPERVIQKQG